MDTYGHVKWEGGRRSRSAGVFAVDVCADDASLQRKSYYYIERQASSLYIHEWINVSTLVSSLVGSALKSMGMTTP